MWPPRSEGRCAGLQLLRYMVKGYSFYRFGSRAGGCGSETGNEIGSVSCQFGR